MPRKNSSRPAPRPASRPAPKPVSHHPPAPAKANPAPPPAPVQQGGGSILGSIGGAIADGMAFGTGSAIAHRVVDSIMGPRVVQHEHTTVAAAPEPASPAPMATPISSSMADSCSNQAKALQDCINANASEISKCQFYFDMLNECKRGTTVGF